MAQPATLMRHFYLIICTLFLSLICWNSIAEESLVFEDSKLLGINKKLKLTALMDANTKSALRVIEDSGWGGLIAFTIRQYHDGRCIENIVNLEQASSSTPDI